MVVKDITADRITSFGSSQSGRLFIRAESGKQDLVLWSEGVEGWAMESYGCPILSPNTKGSWQEFAMKSKLNPT